MTLTARQHQTLAHLSDNEPRMGCDLAASGVLGVLSDRGLIDTDCPLWTPHCESYWRITPAGAAALERAGQ